MRSQQGFQIAMQVIIMPLMFASGIIFPLNNIPPGWDLSPKSTR